MLKGWGLVTYADPTSASAAIDLLNDSELEGRTISVRPDRDAGGGGGGGTARGCRRRRAAAEAPRDRRIGALRRRRR